MALLIRRNRREVPPGSLCRSAVDLRCSSVWLTTTDRNAAHGTGKRSAVSAKGTHSTFCRPAFRSAETLSAGASEPPDRASMTRIDVAADLDLNNQLNEISGRGVERRTAQVTQTKRSFGGDYGLGIATPRGWN